MASAYDSLIRELLDEKRTKKTAARPNVLALQKEAEELLVELRRKEAQAKTEIREGGRATMLPPQPHTTKAIHPAIGVS